MEDSKTISRGDFLKNIPKYFASTVRSFTKVLDQSKSIETGKEGLDEIQISNKRTAKLIADYCLAGEGGSCQFCYLACPARDKAIVIEDQKPIINPLFCDGCSQCVTACQTVNTIPAITMVNR